MRLLTDPDAAMKDKFVHGEVTLDEAAPFELLYHIFPYASWCARVAANFFIGEVPTCVVNLLAFIKGEMSFRAPSGAVALYPAYNKVSQLLTLCAAQRATFNVTDAFLAVCLKLEMLGDGQPAPIAALLDWMLEARVPYRQGAPVPPHLFTELISRIGVLADIEAKRSSMKTPGVVAQVPPRRAQNVSYGGLEYHSAGDGDDQDSRSDDDDSFGLRVQATTFARPIRTPRCSNCEADGVAGTFWLPCCVTFSEPVQICDACHGVTPSRQFSRSGCRNRLSLPPCGTDDEVNIKIGSAHAIPTPTEIQMLNRNFERLKAFRARQKSAWAQQDQLSARARAVNMVRDDSPPAASETTPAGYPYDAPSPMTSGTPVKRAAQHTSGRAPDGPRSLPGSDRSNGKKAIGKPSSPAPTSVNLSTTFHVLDTEQIPLLSLTVLEQAARAAGGFINHNTCSETNTATLVLKLPNEQLFVLRARREHGYSVVRGDVADGRVILTPQGSIVFILDTGAQANVMGPDNAHLLVGRTTPSPDLRLYGAGSAPLIVSEVGTLIFAFSNGSGLTSMVPKRMIQMIRTQVGYRVQVIVHLSIDDEPEPWVVDTGASSSLISPGISDWLFSPRVDAVPRLTTALPDTSANSTVVSELPRPSQFGNIDAVLDTCVVMGSTTSPR